MRQTLLEDIRTVLEKNVTQIFSTIDRFLKIHGSHVITGVTFGSRLDQYAFAEQSSSYTARDFTVKACATLAKDVKVSSLSLSLYLCVMVLPQTKLAR